MSKKTIHVILIVMMLAGLISACVGMNTPGTETPVPTITRTPSITRTPIPSRTASVTKTPTITPTATRIPEVTIDPGVSVSSFSPLGTFVVNFLTPMDTASSALPLLTFPVVAGNYAWNASATTLSFQPGEPLSIGQTYTFFLDSSLRTAGGGNLEAAYEWTVQVDSGPVVISHSPSASQIDSRQPKVTIMFNRAMNTELTGKAFSIQPALAYELTWMDDHTAEVQITEAMQPGLRYDFSFAGVGSAEYAVDDSGIALQEEYVASYWTLPLEMSLDVIEENAFEVKFNYAVESVDFSTLFSIEPALQGTWSWKSEKRARFESAEPFPLASHYTVTVSASLADAYGPLQTAPSALEFSALPPFTIENPGEKSSYSNDYYYYTDLTSIVVSFDLPVDHASVESAFQIFPDMPGTFVWTGDPATSGQEKLEFYPARLLEGETEYTVSILPTARSAQGQALVSEPVEITFTTRALSYWGYDSFYMLASFGDGSRVQEIHTAGERKLQFSAHQGRNVEFELYVFQQADFLNLYANRFGTRSDWAESRFLPVPADGVDPVAQWSYTAETDDAVDETTIPAEVKPGLYVLNLLIEGRLYDQLFVALADNLVLAKLSGQELFVWVKDFDGTGVANAEVLVYSPEGKILYQGRTDAGGALKLTLSEGASPMLVMARAYQPDGHYDLTFTGLDVGWRSVLSYSSNNWRDWLRRGDPQAYQVYAYTDRPIYLPGQTVYYNVVLRRDQDVNYSLPSTQTPVTVNLRDGRENLLETTELFPDQFGCVNGVFELSEGIILGKYHLEVVINGEIHQQEFEVEEYRKPDFEIDIQPDTPGQNDYFVVGDTVTMKIDAHYFFGEPVSGAAISATVYYLQPDYYSMWFGSSTEPSYTWTYTNSVSVQQGQYLGQDGTGNLDITLDQFDYYEGTRDGYSGTTYAMYGLEVTVDDGSNQSVTSSYIFKVYSAEEKVVLDNGGYFQQPDQPFTVRASLTDLQNLPLANRKLTLTVLSWDRANYEFVEGDSQTYSLETDANGQVKQEITLPSGYFEIKVSSTDAGGHTVSDETYVFAFSSPDDWWNRTRDEIIITALQDSYLPNETARFMIESEFSGPALLTFERGHVIHSIPVELTAPLTVIDARILPEFAPNVYVTINAWQESAEVEVTEYDYEYWGSNTPDAYLRMASVQISVPSDDKALTVNIATDQPVYSPGDTMQVTLDVRDASGAPVSAQVSLAVVDEAIFSLKQDLSPNIFDAFYGPRSWTVKTYDSMAPDRILIEPGGRGSGGGSPLFGNPRSDFDDTTAWFPALQTGPDGKVTVTVDLPDNLTSWRLTARAVTRTSQVGQNYINVQTKKPLIVRPILPNSLTTGDVADLVAMVHNYGNETRTVAVSLQASGIEVQGDVIRSVEVGAGDVVPVGWTVKATGEEETQVVFNALADNGDVDAVSLPLVLQPATILDIRTSTGDFKGSIQLAVNVPVGISPSSQITLDLYRSPGAAVLSGLDYLTGYPYGCVEQTMSRALPNAVIGRVGNLLGDPGLQARTTPLIQESIHRIYGFQHSDGGWGWWYDDRSNDYQTAWVLFGLAQISEAGYDVDAQVIARGVGNLSNDLENMDVRTRAFALYSMALNGQGDLDAALELAGSSVNDLDPFSQAALALALYKMGETDQARSIMESLERTATHRGDQVYWLQDVSDGEYNRKTMSSTLRGTALVLEAYLTIDPGNDRIPGITKYLLRQRKADHSWGTTNETAFTIMALTDALLLQQQTVGNTTYAVSWNGEIVQEGILGPGRMSASVSLPLDVNAPGAQSIQITTSGNVTLLYSVREKYGITGMQLPSAGPLRITRSYYDPDTNLPLGTFENGQLVEVRLKVYAGSDLAYVVLEDHLPGGWQALNESLNTTPHVSYVDEYGYDYYYYFDEESLFEYNNKQIYGDRVSFFITDLEAGSHTITYLARVTLTGQFLALPAEAYAMYDLSAWGRSSSDWIIVR